MALGGPPVSPSDQLDKMYPDPPFDENHPNHSESMKEFMESCHKIMAGAED
jgi:hypothetical protein